MMSESRPKVRLRKENIERNGLLQEKNVFQIFIEHFLAFLLMQTRRNTCYRCSQKALMPTKSLTQLMHWQLSPQGLALY